MTEEPITEAPLENDAFQAFKTFRIWADDIGDTGIAQVTA